MKSRNVHGLETCNSLFQVNYLILILMCPIRVQKNRAFDGKIL